MHSLVRIFIDRIPERTHFKLEYKKDLQDQARSLQIPGNLIGIFVWLGFAFITDPKLHPEFPELLYFRLGLTVLSCSFLFLFVTPWGLRRKSWWEGLPWAYTMYAYVLFSTAFFTGRIASDTAYVSGFQMVIMILPFFPFPRVSLLFYYPISILIFLTSILMYKPDLTSAESLYSLQNLFISYLLGTVSGLIIERYRFHSFLNQKRMSQKNSEITKSISEIKSLKESQDGDYFLTSLLFSPLFGKEIESDKVKINLEIDQYKKFQFRGKEYQLGGDYLSVYNLILQGKQYKSFINGDAMGKSIQGAGGAIVLGAVFNSIIIRSKMDPSSSDRSPERWLYDCALDLQKVFETFDGAMLVSCVLGLLEEVTGTFYFINMEHPKLVLYRKGKASFLEESIQNYKLGVFEETFETAINVFPMEPGDTIFCGSDGKDDLVLSESGRYRDINENPTLFLKHIEHVKGNPGLVKESLRKSGLFVDDFSLISLEWVSPSIQPKGEYFEAVKRALLKRKFDEALYLLRSYSSSLEISVLELRWMAKIYEKNGDLMKAVEYASLALESAPADTHWLFHTSVLYKRLFSQQKSWSFLTESQELGERVRLRNPNDLKAVIHLIDVYRLIGNRERALFLLQLLQKKEPNHPKIPSLRSLF